MKNTENTGKTQKRGNPDTLRKWQPGQSGNPGGRPKERIKPVLLMKLSDKVIADIVDSWIEDATNGLDGATRSRARQQILDRVDGAIVQKQEQGPVGAFGELDEIPEDAARAVIEASERFTSGSRRASK